MDKSDISFENIMKKCGGSTEGFSDEYTLPAMEAEPGFGLIYALEGKNNQFVYMELIFCNYFYDIDYKNMMPGEYLLAGYDATVESPYRQQRLGRTT